MEKQELLAEIARMSHSGLLSQSEVNQAMFGGVAPAPSETLQHHLSLSDIMYYVGGGIVFLGICVLTYQNWTDFSSVLRILITLGSCLAAYIMAALFYRYEDLKKVSQAFFLISGLLAPLGLNVAFKESGLDLNSSGLQTLIYVILTTVYLGSLWFFAEQTILLFFGTVFATATFHNVIGWIVGPNLLSSDLLKIWEYRILVEGFAWIFLGYYLSQGKYKALTGVMYGIGSLGFLGAALALGGWTPDQSVFWELVYPLLVFGVIFMSVYVKSKAFLTFGAIFLIGYILKITSEYFASSSAWPLALVMAGLAIMGVGYYAVRISKKYIA